MKKILLTVALLAAFVVNASAQAVIKYDKSSHDFGKFDEEKKLTIRKRRYRLERKAKSRLRTTARGSRKAFSGK